MVFHSYQFILLALPACYAGFLLAHRIAGWEGAFRFLVVASLAFYAQWSVYLVLALMASVMFNYGCSRLILKFANDARSMRLALIVGIGGNIAALAYLRYANFLIDIANTVTFSHVAHLELMIPIGVSFYTFIQIGYLIDCYAGQIKDPGFTRYVLFATFFPCVTAGPLVQSTEMLSQMKDREDRAFHPVRLAAGLAMFAMGLFKKVAIADQIAPFADDVFLASAHGEAMSGLIAWIGATCYALQLYFDFSGYSDMALGLGCIFGIKLPINFNSPFKTTNISDFWRAWHMTMTRFFTTYIYTPIAVKGMRSMMGRKVSDTERYLKTAAIPAVATFLVAGIWHGAGWTFVVYGLIHGVAIATYLGWSRFARFSLPPAAGWLLTMAVVVSALVVFRAPDLKTAWHLLGAMWTFGHATSGATGSILGGFQTSTAAASVIVLGAIVLLLPNTHQIMNRYWMATDDRPETFSHEAGLLQWRPTLSTAVAMGLLMCLALGSIGGGSTFLYYQF